MNIRGLYSNFVGYESFLESNWFDIYALCETNLNDSIDNDNLFVKGYLPLIRNDSVTHTDSFTVNVKKGLPFAGNLPPENYVDSYLCFQLALLHSLSNFFVLCWSHSLLLCTVFDTIPFNIDKVVLTSLSNLFVFGYFDVYHNRLRSRVPLSKRMHSIASDINGTTSPKSWATTTWRRQCQNSNYQLCQYIPEPSAKPPGHDLKQHQWVLLNPVRSGYGWYASFMNQIGLNDNPNCICGEVQTHQHVLTCHTIGVRADIKTVDEDFWMWLTDHVLDI